MPAKRVPEIDAEIDALFQGALTDFTASRNALASRLKKEGRALDAERVKSLSKPPAPAWAVNQIYWQDPKALAQLLEIGERLRKAQTGQSKNADLRTLIEEKKTLMTSLVARASQILGEPSVDATRRVTATLESLAAWGDAEGAPRERASYCRSRTTRL